MLRLASLALAAAIGLYAAHNINTNMQTALALFPAAHSQELK